MDFESTCVCQFRHSGTIEIVARYSKSLPGEKPVNEWKGAGWLRLA